MKTVTKLVMGAVVLAASAGAAHAANTTLPSTDNSNLMFFVNDATAHSTYTIVLSQLINGSSGYFTNADATSATAALGVVNPVFGDANFTLSLASDTTLESFVNNAESSGDSLQWGIQNAAYSGVTPTAREAQGAVLAVATVASTGNPLTVGENAISGAIPADFNTDAGHLNTKTLDSFNGTSQGIYGTSASAGGTNINLYGNGTVVGSAIGSSAGLFGFTANAGNGADAYAFSLGTVSFDGSTLTFTGNTASAPVPLPAAAWLFGSGLLGLFGVGRRRDRALTAA